MTAVFLHTPTPPPSALDPKPWLRNEQTKGAFAHNHHDGWVVVRAHFQPQLPKIKIKKLKIAYKKLLVLEKVDSK
jgi:hypothetical protein